MKTSSPPVIWAAWSLAYSALVQTLVSPPSEPVTVDRTASRSVPGARATRTALYEVAESPGTKLSASQAVRSSFDSTPAPPTWA
ncbi:hypothetical protein D3C74_406960 [compost metagenome]